MLYSGRAGFTIIPQKTILNRDSKRLHLGRIETKHQRSVVDAFFPGGKPHPLNGHLTLTYSYLLPAHKY